MKDKWYSPWQEGMRKTFEVRRLERGAAKMIKSKGIWGRRVEGLDVCRQWVTK